MQKSNTATVLTAAVFTIAVGLGCATMFMSGCSGDSSDQTNNGNGGTETQGSSGKQKSETQQPLFAGWSTPGAVLIFSGQQYGYLEPCGCSPEFQKGGLAARHGFIKKVHEKKWPSVLVDLGAILENRFKQAPADRYMPGQEHSQIKLRTTLKALNIMGYSTVGLTPEDLFVSNGFNGLLGEYLNLGDPIKPKGMSANLSIDSAFIESEMFDEFSTVEAGETTWGFTAIVCKSHQDHVMDGELAWRDPLDPELMNPRLKQIENTDVKVLLCYGSFDEAKAIVAAYPVFSVVIHASEYEEPTGIAEVVDHCTYVTVGTKGKYVGAVGYYPESDEKFKFELVSLDSRFTESPEIREVLDNEYLDALADAGLVQNSPKVMFDPADQERSYVGSQKCGECHRQTFAKWKASKHAKALDVLVEKGKHVNPECISCHTVGYLYKTGYDGTEATAILGGNGCENCHGPGSKHVATFMNPKATQEETSAAKAMLRLEAQTPEDNLCVRCHDAENDPKFEFYKRWTDIEHKAEAEKDRAFWPTVRKRVWPK